MKPTTRPLRSLKNYYHWIQAEYAYHRYRRPSRKLTIIGVTGTDGKTTTSTLIYHILNTAGYKVALISTVAAYIGDQVIHTGFHVTTPNSSALQSLLHNIVTKDYTHVVIEATSHGLDQHRLLGINPHTAVYTNISHEHLDYHKTYQNYVQAKAKLMQGASHIVLNKQDKSFAYLKPFIPSSAQVHTYPITNDTVLSVINQQFPEEYNQQNAQAAALTAQIHDVTTSDIIKGIKTFAGIPGRMERVARYKGAQIIVDFAHTPNALLHALTALKPRTTNRLISVFGSAGLRDRQKRPSMANISSGIADLTILTAEDPRTEDVDVIIQQMKDGVTQNHNKVISINNRFEAIKFTLKIAKKGDVIGIFGKGHEQSMNIDGLKEIPWSDKEVIQKLIH